MTSGNWLRRRLIEPFLELLKQGVAPDKLALSLALGVAIGLIPILGLSTGLCALTALLLRLNMPAIQLVNYALSPLQLLLIIPAVRFGEYLTGAPAFPITIAAGMEIIAQGPLHAIETLWDAIVHAALAWIVLAPPVTLVVFLGLRLLLTRYQRRDSFR